MRHCVQQGGSKFFTLPRGLDLRREILRPRPFQPNGDEVGDSLENGIRHLSALGARGPQSVPSPDEPP